MNKEEIIQMVGFDLDKAKAIYQWLTDDTLAQPIVQPTSDTDLGGISIHTDDKGAVWVRVKVLDEDFLIAAHDYIEGETEEFDWDKACEVGTFSVKQAHIVCAFKDEINAKLREIGGDELKDCYWSSTEYYSGNAWYVHFSNGYIDTYGKYNSFTVRPVAAFN